MSPILSSAVLNSYRTYRRVHGVAITFIWAISWIKFRMTQIKPTSSSGYRRTTRQVSRPRLSRR